MSSFAIPLYLSLPVKSKQKCSARRRNEKKLNYRYNFVTYCALAVIRDRVQSGAGQFPEYIADFIVRNSKKDTLQYEIHSIKKGPVLMHRSFLFSFLISRSPPQFSRRSGWRQRA